MSKANDGDLFRGSSWSKLLGFLSIIFLLLTGVTLISRIDTYDPVSKKIISSEIPWKIAILWFALSFVTGVIAYRLAGRRRNPAIWKGGDLYELIKHATLSGEAKIGFHSLRDQGLLLVKLESIGIIKKPSEDVRQFIRNKIVMDRRAFDILRDHVIIELVHGGREWFWDGYGRQRAAQYFHEAEIIFNIGSSVGYMFFEVLEGLKADNSGK